MIIKAPFKLINWIIVLMMRLIIRICTFVFFRPRVYYVNKKVQKRRIRQSAIIISNHTYYLDGVLIGTLFYRDKIYSFTAKDLFTNKLKSWMMNGCRCIPLDRTEVDATWMHKGVDVLRKGYPVCIFPEGKSNYNGEIDEFKPGFLLLAIRTKSPIIPMCIDGPYEFVVGQRQRILIGEPIYVEAPKDGVTKAFLQEEAQKYRDLILHMQRELRKKHKRRIKPVKDE